MRKQKIREKKLTDVVYIDGYTNGLLLLLASDEDRLTIPLLYAYGQETHPSNMKQYREYLNEASTLHKTAYTWCKRFIKNNPDIISGIVVHHAPTLL